MHHSVSLPRALVLSAVLLGAAGCGGSSATSPSAGTSSQSASSAPLTIDIKNFKFQQSPVTVKMGTQVTWTNQDPQPTNHTATADQGAFDTGSIPPNGSVTRTLTTAGTITYHCGIHEYMTGTITVVS